MIFGISVIRWALIFLSSYMIGKGITRFIKKETSQSFFKTTSTIIIWGVILTISLFPDFAYFVSRKLGMGSNLNTLIFFGFVVVFMILFRILSIIEVLERQITTLTREIALRDKDKKISKSFSSIYNNLKQAI